MVLRKPGRWGDRLDAMVKEADRMPFSPKIKDAARRAAEKVRESMENLPVGEDEFVLREDEGTTAQVEDDATLEVPLAPLANELSEADTDFIFNVTEALKSEASDIVGNPEGVTQDDGALDTIDEVDDMSNIKSMEGYVLREDLYVKLSEDTLGMLGVTFSSKVNVSPRAKEGIYSLGELREIIKVPGFRKGLFLGAVRLRFCDSGDKQEYHQGMRLFKSKDNKACSLGDFLLASGAFGESTTG